MSKYQDIMNKIEVTDEMKSRILQNLEKELENGAEGGSGAVKPGGAGAETKLKDTSAETKLKSTENPGDGGNKIRKFEFRKYMPMVAALVVFVISAYVVINVLPAKQANYSGAPMMDSAMTESATEMAAETAMDSEMEAPMAAEEAAEAEPVMEAAEYAAEDNANKDAMLGAQSAIDAAKNSDKDKLTSGAVGTESAIASGGTENADAAVITEDQALEAIRNYCFANNPELESMMNSGDYTIYFDASTNDAGEIVVLFRSYTAAQIRYYIDPVSGEVYVTELVPGIIDEEQKTDESFNIRDYMSNGE